MAFDGLPFGVRETSPLSVGVGGTGLTPGAIPAPQTAAMGVLVEVSGTADGTYDLIVETAVLGTLAGANWQALTSTRLNALTGVDTWRIPFVDAVMDQVRLRVVRTGGTGAALFTPTWLTDREGISLI